MICTRFVQKAIALALLMITLLATGDLVQVAGQQPHRDDSPGNNDPRLPTQFRRISEHVYCGAHPTTEKAFAALAEQNIKTVVSVDGTKPKLSMAKRHGIRYVHIPIGYGKVNQKSLGTIARMASEVEKPIYVHCHLGKHRGPAVAAIASMEMEEINHQEAIKFLTMAGTDKKYVGLWESVETHQRPIPTKAWPRLVEVSKVDPFVSAMSKMIGPVEKLQAVETAGWSSKTNTTNAEFQNFEPKHLAVLIKENFREAVRSNPNVDDKVFSGYLAESEKLSRQLEEKLDAKMHEDASAVLNSLLMNCARCHEEYR